jgi:hypothetical protein
MQKSDYQQLAHDFTFQAAKEATRSFGDGNAKLLFNRNGESCILIDIKTVANPACETADGVLPVVMQMAANPVPEGEKTIKLRRLEELKTSSNNSGTYEKPSANTPLAAEERPLDEMVIDFAQCPAFTEDMFYMTLRMLREANITRGNLFKIDTTNTNSIDRQIKISGFDPEHLGEQARLLVQAIKGGIIFAQAGQKPPRVIDMDRRHALYNSRIFVDYNFITMGL